MDPFELRIKAGKAKKLKEAWEAVEQQRDLDTSVEKKKGKLGPKTVTMQQTSHSPVSHIFQKHTKPSHG